MKISGWMFIGFSKDYPQGKIESRRFMGEECLVCPMHSRAFKGEGSCVKATRKSIRSYPTSENRGRVYAWFEKPGLQPQWPAPAFLRESGHPDIPPPGSTGR